MGDTCTTYKQGTVNFITKHAGVLVPWSWWYIFIKYIFVLKYFWVPSFFFFKKMQQVLNAQLVSHVSVCMYIDDNS